MSDYFEILQKQADQYFRESGQLTATTAEIASWALRTRRWEAPANLILQKCKEDFARAMREQYINDEHGRPVRTKHAARIRSGDEQIYLWADIHNAPTDHMRVAFQQRREQIVGDCRQLKRDMDYYNGLRPKEVDQIQLVFDFTDDVAEGEVSGQFIPTAA